MLRTAIRGLMAHKLRLVASAMAITLGVAFMAGTLVLGDTIKQTFDQLFTSVYQGTDAVVRSSTTIDSPDGGPAQRAEIPETLIATVQSTPGVADAVGSTSGYAQFIDHDGKAIGDPQPGRADHRQQLGLEPDAEPLPHRHGASARAGRRGGRRPPDRRQVRLRRRPAGRHPHQGRPHDGSRRRDREVRFAGQPARGRRWRCSIRPPPPGSSGGPATCRPSGSRPRPASRRPTSCGPSGPGLPAHTEAITGRRGHQGVAEPDPAGPVVLQHVPDRVRGDRPVRGVVHHLQHVLDHRGPAHPRDGAAAGHRCQPEAGAGLGARRGARGRHHLGRARPGLRRAGRRRPQGPAGAVGFGIPASGTVVKVRSIVVAFIAGVGVTMVVALAPALPGVAGRRPWPPCASVAVDRSGQLAGCARSSACSSWAAAWRCCSPGCSAT